MNRLKRYHLGCGEPLQSQHAELMSVVKAASADRDKVRAVELRKHKPVKRH